MSNANPYQARLAKALRHKPDDLDATRRRCWGILCLAYDEVGVAEDAEARRNAILAYAQVAGAYVKLWEAGEYEARLSALEENVHALIASPQTGTPGH
jgi:hypothetical protein